ncbi:MAG: hypothetical protein ISS19_04225 [Bacteroidales bacterium]|nr:hypothetical protein [Bacteroidales bacterium]
MSNRKRKKIYKFTHLKEAGFRCHWLYMAGVRFGGAFYGSWKVKNTQTDIKITSYSWLNS